MKRTYEEYQTSCEAFGRVDRALHVACVAVGPKHLVAFDGRDACPPLQPHQLPGQPGRRAHCLLPSVQKAFSRLETSRPTAGLAYPEFTLLTLDGQQIFS